MAESAVPDVLAPGLRIVFCGINPGFRSAEAGAHFANPRNDFWRLLADADLTPRVLVPEEQWQMLDLGYGLTNAAYRTTKGSSDLRRGDFAGSAERLERLARGAPPGDRRVRRQSGLRRRVSGEARARPTGETLGDRRLFVLPSTSPANAAVSYAERLCWFRKLRDLAAL